jgi:hypothetical protein
MYRLVMMGAVLLAAVGCGAGEPMETGETEAPAAASSRMEAAATGGDAALMPAACSTCDSTRRLCVQGCDHLDYECRAQCGDEYEICIMTCS